MNRALVAALVVAGATACGSKKEREPAPPPPPMPAPRDRLKPVERPTRAPVAITLAELEKKLPVVANARVIAPLALDGSGKQATARWCVPGADARAALHAVADQLAMLHWELSTRETTSGHASGQLAGDLAMPDAALHVQAAIRKTPACNEGEQTVEFSYTKMLPLAAAPLAPGAPAGGPPDRLQPRPAPPR